jgi:hypothetical protein
MKTDYSRENCLVEPTFPKKKIQDTVLRFKAAEYGLNLLLWCNAQAGHHFKQYILYHSANFRNFKNVSNSNLSVCYRSYAKALIRTALFEDSLINCFLPEKGTSLMKQQFILTHTTRQTEIPALLDSLVTNTPSVKMLYSQKISCLIFS